VRDPLLLSYGLVRRADALLLLVCIRTRAEPNNETLSEYHARETPYTNTPRLIAAQQRDSPPASLHLVWMALQL
jgi:hypothetical protein